jgi:hypothetical protein
MIWEPSYWKHDLLKLAGSLRKRMNQKRWGDASHARFEQTLMLGFYSIRKLIEAKRLSNAIEDQQISVIAYPSLGTPVTRMNWHKFDRLYDQDAGAAQDKSVIFICNQFIHSYVFIGVFNEDRRLSHVIVASEFKRNSFAYEIDLNRVIMLFESVGTDDPNEVRFTLNPKTHDYDVWQAIRTDDVENTDAPILE